MASGSLIGLSDFDTAGRADVKPCSAFFGESVSPLATDLHTDPEVEWFWKWAQTITPAQKRTLLRYITELKVMPVTHRIKVVKSANRKISRLSIPKDTHKKRVSPHTADMEHVLLLPTFESYKCLERDMLDLVSYGITVSFAPECCENETQSVFRTAKGVLHCDCRCRPP